MPDNPPSGECLRVVIVDDVAAIREVLRRLTTIDARIEVVGEAADGLEALAVVGEVEPDAVLLDVRMPVLDGVDTVRRLKGAAQVRIVMYSADSSRKREALAAGADAWIDKDEGLMAVADALAALMPGHPPEEQGTSPAPVRTER